MDRISQSTEKVLQFLKGHPLVDRIHYPMDKDHPQHELAKRQLSWCGGLFAMELKLSPREVEEFCNRLECFQMAVSWGGHESLIIPAIALSAKGEQGAIPSNLVRVYIGLEDPETLIRDIEQALNQS
jgi:cystathionine beta-lyase/cystathionine gamma-synthase